MPKFDICCKVVRSLFYIFQALQLQAVPYLPKVRAPP